MTEYLLTPSVKKRLETLGFILRCYRCGDPLRLGDTVVSSGSKKVKKLLHKHCWVNQSAEEAVSPKLVSSRNRQSIPIWGKPKIKPQHIRLVKGVFSNNPGEVLCPTLIRNGSCRRCDRDFKLKRPKLLLKHHSNPNLELWMCAGCEDFLLRVERNA